MIDFRTCLKLSTCYPTNKGGDTDDDSWTRWEISTNILKSCPVYWTNLLLQVCVLDSVQEDIIFNIITTVLWSLPHCCYVLMHVRMFITFFISLFLVMLLFLTFCLILLSLLTDSTTRNFLPFIYIIFNSSGVSYLIHLSNIKNPDASSPRLQPHRSHQECLWRSRPLYLVLPVLLEGLVWLRPRRCVTYHYWLCEHFTE